MYTLSLQHARKITVLYFNEGWSSEPFVDKKDSEPRTINQLTDLQRSIVDQILQQLDQNPGIWIQIGVTLKGVYDIITHNPEKLNALLEAIEQAKQARLDAISSKFNSWEITWPVAATLSHDVVIHYGHLAQKSFQDSFSPSLTTV